jgi:hypothetical protein
MILKAVTFDCDNALVVAEFWSKVFDRPVDTQPVPASPSFA